MFLQHLHAVFTLGAPVLAAPLGVVGAGDDTVHPLQVAVEWVAAAPRAALRTVTLQQFGADTAELGAACLGALADL